MAPNGLTMYATESKAKPMQGHPVHRIQTMRTEASSKRYARYLKENPVRFISSETSTPPDNIQDPTQMKMGCETTSFHFSHTNQSGIPYPTPYNMRQSQQEQHNQDSDTVPEPKQKDLDAILTIYIKATTGESLSFLDNSWIKPKWNTKLMGKLQKYYRASEAKRNGIDVGGVRFLYDGEQIRDDDTPASLSMNDYDTIDVMVEQVGGFSVTFS